jgi:hypothetical protein
LESVNIFQLVPQARNTEIDTAMGLWELCVLPHTFSIGKHTRARQWSAPSRARAEDKLAVTSRNGALLSRSRSSTGSPLNLWKNLNALQRTSAPNQKNGRWIAAGQLP